MYFLSATTCAMALEFGYMVANMALQHVVRFVGWRKIYFHQNVKKKDGLKKKLRLVRFDHFNTMRRLHFI